MFPGQNLLLKRNFVFQPVHFQTQQHLSAPVAGSLFGKFPYFAHIIRKVCSKLFTILAGVVVAERTGRVFGKAMDHEATLFARFVHFLRGIVAVGIQGVRVQIRINHTVVLR